MQGLELLTNDQNDDAGGAKRCSAPTVIRTEFNIFLNSSGTAQAYISSLSYCRLQVFFIREDSPVLLNIAKRYKFNEIFTQVNLK